jgi:hypothetical protein
MIDRDRLNALPCVPPSVTDESEHFYVCAICGQAVDKRRLGDVLWHEEPEHGPLPIDG